MGTIEIILKTFMRNLFTKINEKKLSEIVCYTLESLVFVIK